MKKHVGSLDLFPEEPLINAELLKHLALLMFITQEVQAGIGKEHHKKQETYPSGHIRQGLRAFRPCDKLLAYAANLDMVE